MSELLAISLHDVVVGMAQAAAATVLCLAVVFLCRRFAVHVERETVLSLARGLVQMVAVGMLLALLLHGSLPIAILILLAMAFAAAVTAGEAGPGYQATLASLLLRDCRRGRGHDRSHACHQDTHLRSDHPGARRQHDHRQCNECLCAGNGAL